MASMLTREKLEAHIAAATEKLAEGGGEVVAELLQIYRMALGFLEMQPRPISEAPKDTALLVIEKRSGFPWEIAHFNTYRKAWVRNIDGVPISIPTHFIPLSSLQEPKE